MPDISVRVKLVKLLIQLHYQFLKLDLRNVEPKGYLSILLQHCWALVRSSSEKGSKNEIFTRHARLILWVFAALGLGSSFAAVLGVSKIASFWRQKGSLNNKLHSAGKSQLLLNGTRELLISEGSKEKKVVVTSTEKDQYEHDKYLFKNLERDVRSQLFNSKFLQQLNVISTILIPKFLHKNSLMLSSQIFFLILRTWLSLMVARLDGQIVKDIISGRPKRFVFDMACWFFIAFPASYTNSAIKYIQRKLSLNFRARLTRYIHDMYLDKRLVFYKTTFDNEATNSIIANIDNSITNDVQKFCDAVTNVFANVAKPVIDLVFFSIYLRDSLGSIGVVGIFLNYFLTGYILRKYSPPLGKLVSSRSSSEGDYYNYHLNMINNSEEIAFYQGTNVERTKVNNLYDKLMDQMLLVDRSKVEYNIVEDYILKYTWSAWGYVFASIPIVLHTWTSEETSESANMKEFIMNKRLMLSLADAGTRLMHSIKDISQLTGYTNRIFVLLKVLHRVHDSDFDYGMVTSSDEAELNSTSTTVVQKSAAAIRGTIQHDFNGIRFENIDVIIPSAAGTNGVTLVKGLTFQIPEIINLEPSSSKHASLANIRDPLDQSRLMNRGMGSSLLILGPNSCGKSSIERILTEIWPIYNKNGLLSIPPTHDLFCVPQRPYFIQGGTFRDQIIYPMTYEQFYEKGYKDTQLVQILCEVRLEYLLKRERGLNYFNAIADWKDVLSGGEKQRMNFARIMFHRPRFVVLDEATNAISVDMEDHLFTMMKRCRFNFISISQRPSLIKYHDYLLELTNGTDWSLKTLGSDEVILSIENEIDSLQQKLTNVKEWERKKDELQAKLALV
ncbi:unnamed protein product [Kluyveromyces dobzhanskii CBS 2104]|uniref:WGS project CCBQ000000000 data, contig 00015 n=1 Tax=Kluyveromyces dobzhanskii CBS 2104 TaxID=1427455 RepID=A0A0A8LAC6_9SACH|nr:unnamed protein product [Kluyveromyces dobzhanskii CBS 2104]